MPKNMERCGCTISKNDYEGAAELLSYHKEGYGGQKQGLNI